MLLRSVNAAEKAKKSSHVFCGRGKDQPSQSVRTLSLQKPRAAAFPQTGMSRPSATPRGIPVSWSETFWKMPAAGAAQSAGLVFTTGPFLNHALGQLQPSEFLEEKHGG